MGIEYVLEKDIVGGVNFINKALENEDKEEIKKEWIIQLPYMTSDTYISFVEFYNTLRPKAMTTMTNEEILKESEEILRKMEKQKEGETIGS